MRYNVLSNGFFVVAASCDYGLPDYLFQKQVRIAHHDLALLDALNICKVSNQKHCKTIEYFIERVLGTDTLEQEPPTAWKPRVNRWENNKYEETHQHTPKEIY